MLRLKSMSVNFALLLSLAAFTATADNASAVDIPIPSGDAGITNAMNTVLADPAVKNVMNSKRDEVLAEKIQTKPLMGQLMPKMEGVMMPIMKEVILPHEMDGLAQNLSQKIAPNF